MRKLPFLLDEPEVESKTEDESKKGGFKSLEDVQKNIK